MWTVKNTEQKLYIEKLVYGGCGLSIVNNKAVFTKYVAAGESVHAKITKKKKGVFWADLLEVEKLDESVRVEPICQHFGQCGGCSYQHLDYEHQVRTKQKILQELFPDLEQNEPIFASDPAQRWHYRNKCEFTFSEERDTGEFQLGLHAPGKYFEILDLKECHIVHPLMWRLSQDLKGFAENSSLGAYHDIRETGFWATATIRVASDEKGQEQLILLLKVKDSNHQILQELSEWLGGLYGDTLVGIFAFDAPRGDIQCISGQKYLYQQILSEVRYSVGDFFQVNINMFRETLSRINELVSDIQPEVVLDLFAGVGVIGMAIADANPAIQVIGAESNPGALDIPEMPNYTMHHLDLYKSGWIDTVMEGIEDKDICLVVDPPRAGLTKKTVKQISEINPRNIIYMSCNPTTQQRDIEMFVEYGYNPQSLQLIDMFPQTYHIESLMTLQK